MTTTPLRPASAPPSIAQEHHEWPIRIFAAALMTFTAAGAVFGGVAMITDPHTPLGATTALLEGSPFHTFTWPGILLLTLVGVTPALIAIGIVSHVRPALALGVAWGVGLMAWIATQWVLLDNTMWLQPVFFCTGLLVTLAAAIGLRRGLR